MADEFYCAIAKGHVRALKHCVPVRHNLGRHASVTRMEWHLAPHLSDVAERLGGTVDHAAAALLAMTSNNAIAREQGLTIRVRKDGLSAVFAIDMLRTPYFFADREKVVTENGQTKKIFHIVRGHWRTLAGGHRKFIKPHFRGLREFDWNGYEVRISLAGLHGQAASSFRAPAADPMTDEPTVNMDKLAERLEEVMV